MKILNAVLAHKDFEWTDLDKDSLNKFLVISPNKIKTNLPHIQYFDSKLYNDKLYSEISHLFYVRDNIESDWVVVNHYRRRFMLPDYKTIYIPTPLKFKYSVKEMYATFHNIEDLEYLTRLVMESNLTYEFKSEWIKSLDDNYMICYNMASCPRKLFNDWIDTLYLLLNQFKEDKKLTIEKLNEETKIQNNTHEPTRILGFLGERISNCYWRVYSKKHNVLPIISEPIYPCDVKLLEEKMVI